MILSIDQKERTVFQLWVDKANTAYTLLEDDLIAEIRRMRAMGISDEEIFSRIETSLLNGADMFQRFKGYVEREMDTLLETSAQIESNDGMKEVGDLVWVLDPTAKEHCEDCLRNSEMGAKTFEEWSLIGLPGMGNTECGHYCKCTLDAE